MTQSIDEVDGAMADYITRTILTPDALTSIIAMVRAEVERYFSAVPNDAAKLEAELAQVKAEQKKYADAIAMTGDGDIPELVAALKVRNERAKRLQADIAAAKRGPSLAREIIERAEQATTARLADLRKTLAGDRAGAREVFLALFPRGLTFRPVPSGRRNKMVWEISGTAELRPGSNCLGDPTGT